MREGKEMKTTTSEAEYLEQMDGQTLSSKIQAVALYLLTQHPDTAVKDMAGYYVLKWAQSALLEEGITELVEQGYCLEIPLIAKLMPQVKEGGRHDD